MERVGRRSAKRAKKIGEITLKCFIFSNQKRAEGRKPRKKRWERGMNGRGGGGFGSAPPPPFPDCEINRRLRDSSRFPHYVRGKL